MAAARVGAQTGKTGGPAMADPSRDEQLHCPWPSTADLLADLMPAK